MERGKIKQEILKGKIFIYPTDTVYGIGCDATNLASVEKIKEIKNRDRDKPISIIAPSVKWIEEHCIVDSNLGKYLPGPYTLILKKKDSNFLRQVANGETLGVRIPRCDFTKIVQEVGRPFVTTSVNLSGEPFAVRVSEIKEEILKQVDIVIDEGELDGRPSTFVIDGKEVKR